LDEGRLRSIFRVLLLQSCCEDGWGTCGTWCWVNWSWLNGVNLNTYVMNDTIEQLNDNRCSRSSHGDPWNEGGNSQSEGRCLLGPHIFASCSGAERI